MTRNQNRSSFLPLPPVVECISGKSIEFETKHSSSSSEYTAITTTLAHSFSSSDSLARDDDGPQPSTDSNATMTPPSTVWHALLGCIDTTLANLRTLRVVVIQEHQTPSQSPRKTSRHARPTVSLRLLSAAVLCWTVIVMISLGYCCVYFHGGRYYDASLRVGPPLPSKMQRQLFQSKVRRARVRRRQQQEIMGLSKVFASSSYTVYLRASRLPLLRMALQRIRSCPDVQDIRVQWTGKEVAPDWVLRHEGHQGGAPVFWMPPASSKSRKQKSHVPRFSTAVLLVDESVVATSSLTCDDWTRAWDEWKRDPTRAVGLIPLWSIESMASATASYSLLSDRSLFVHRSYLWAETSLSSSSSRSSLLSVVSHPSRIGQYHDHICQEWVLSARIAALSQTHGVALYHPQVSVPQRVQHEDDDEENEAPVFCHALLAQHLGVADFVRTRSVFVGHSMRT